MEAEKEIPPENLLREQFWTFGQIIEISEWNFSKQQGKNFENKSDFLAKLLEKLSEATKAGDVYRVKSVKKGSVLSAANPYFQMVSDLSKGTFVLLALLVCYWVFGYFPEGTLKKGISPTGAAFITVAIPIVGLLILPGLFQFVDEIRRKRMKTIEDRLKYFFSQAELHGLFDEIFESKSVITFLNKAFEWCLPIDQFRVWREPFMKKSGEAWIIGFEGDQFFLRVDKKTQDTYKRIAYLLLNPYKHVSCLDLIATNPCEESEIKAEAGEFFDDDEPDDSRHFDEDAEEYVSSFQTIKKQLRKIEEDIECARDRGDTVKLENLQSQKEEIIKWMDKTFYPDGKEKDPRGDRERAKDAIKQNRSRFIKKVAKVSPNLAEHLKKSINMYENTVSYRPPEKIEWDIQMG